jgi:hypothetical protein
MAWNLILPRSLEGRCPVVTIDAKLKFGWFLQWPSKIPHLGGRHPFGLWIRIPFVRVRWGCA